MSQPYRAAAMLGRLANGAQADHGTRVHAVRLKQVPSLRTPGIQITTEVALCGARPGRRSIGWSGVWKGDDTLTVDCPRCIKRLEKETP